MKASPPHWACSEIMSHYCYYSSQSVINMVRYFTSMKISSVVIAIVKYGLHVPVPGSFIRGFHDIQLYMYT